MENEAKRKLDFLKRIGDETIGGDYLLGGKINISDARKPPMFTPDSIILFTLVASEYVSKADIAEYFGIEESEVERFMGEAKYTITYHILTRNIYNEMKNRFEKEYGK